jgi:uncharacterized protein YqjF (DUF2071 family)
MGGPAFLESVARQASATEHAGHRPWPLPDEPWTSAQSWVDLAFLHWRVDADELRRLIPESLRLDTFDGSAWLGIVPFQISGLRLRGLPPLPRLSSFPELNVRTYVTHGDRSGIWFFTLEAASSWFVEAGKRFYRVPYNRAQMRCERSGDWVHFESARPGATYSGRHRSHGDLFHARPGTLEYFLTERYCLYTEDGGRLYGADIHHLPWDLQPGEAHVDLNTLAPLTLPDDAPHVLFSPRQDTVVWPLREL